MPIVVDKEYSAYGIFTGGRVSVIDGDTALRRRTKPLEIAILNLTPEKERTEIQFMRLLSGSPLPVRITVIELTRGGKRNENPYGGLYKSFAEAEKQFFDGMIVTGALSDNAAFNRAPFWKEYEDILDWTNSNVGCTLFVCWAAQAALYRFYNIKKHPLKDKCYGVYSHRRIADGLSEPLMRGISDEFTMPHSRHSAIYAKDVMNVMDLKILAYSKRTGASVIKNSDSRRVFVLGHMEYDRYTLKEEYERDLKADADVKPPANYFTGPDMDEVNMSWSSSAALFYQNWLNYCVYNIGADVLAKEA